jgi:hypothetical protein
MAVSGHKTLSIFKPYNLVSEEELSTISWKRNTTGQQEDGPQTKKGHKLEPVTFQNNW